MIARAGWLGSLSAVPAVLFAVTVASSFDDRDTHRRITRGATSASGMDAYVTHELGLSEGLNRVLMGRQGPPQSIRRWLEDGSQLEDSPMCRASNHFHNPLKPFLSSRVTDMPGLDLACDQFRPIQSSVTWATRFVSPAERGPATLNPFDWDAARGSFLNALTSDAPRDREAALAQTFETLGHLVHLVQDLAVPAHVRNNLLSHAEASLSPPKVGVDGFEDHVRRNFSIVGDALPVPVDVAGRLPTRFWDTDRYTGSNPSADTTQGLAEYTNANFVSLNTILTEGLSPSDPYFFPYPRLTGTNGAALFGKDASLARQVRAEDGRVETGLYLDKVGDGETITNFLRAGYLTGDFIDKAPPGTPIRLVLQLDDEVYASYAAKLLPRALGYSAGLLDYFFRGRLDVDLVDSNSGLQLTGINASPEPLDGGTLAVYADDTRGLRVVASDMVATGRVEAGAPLPAVAVTPPEGAERFVAVYKGLLGEERPAGALPGAVIGKVLGGVRVEEVFNDSGVWMLRTPQGIFGLSTGVAPLTTAQYDLVKWGDTDGALIARTPLGVAQPTVVVFDVPRRPGSSDLEISPGTTTVVLRQRPGKSVPFPFGIFLTTVNFTQTISYRQHLARAELAVTNVWVPAPPPNNNPMLNGHYERTASFTPFAFDIAYEQTIPFNETFPVTTDRSRYVDAAGAFDPYFWRLQDLTVDASGRLLGLIVVFLRTPQSAPVTVPVLTVNNLTGIAEPSTTRILRPSFPEQIAPLLWALIDLELGTVVGTGTGPASTADPLVTIDSRLVIDELDRGCCFGNRTFWLHSVETFLGGYNDGNNTDVWSPAPQYPPGYGTIEAVTEVTLPANGEQTLSVDGWLREDLRQAMTSRGRYTLEPHLVPADFRFVYDCDVERLCSALSIRQPSGVRLQDPGQLLAARRPRPVGGNERLVFLSLSFVDNFLTGDFGYIGDLLVWDPGPARARFVGAALPLGFHDMGPATGAAALVSSFLMTGDTGTTLFRLDAAQASTLFPDVDLTQTYTLLEPSYLYNTTDLKFHRPVPSLDKSALPASLAAGGSRTGDYHTIRLP